MIKLFPLGLKKIKDWTQQSLIRRLKKSLSHDWIPERIAHKFPLRQYYVQLEWNQKVRTAMRSQTKTLTSLHDLIKQRGMGTNQHPDAAPSVLIEGENQRSFWHYVMSSKDSFVL